MNMRKMLVAVAVVAAVALSGCGAATAADPVTVPAPGERVQVVAAVGSQAAYEREPVQVLDNRPAVVTVAPAVAPATSASVVPPTVDPWSLPACTYEDGSGPGVACLWNAYERGNGIGMSFWYDTAGEWHWLADGGLVEPTPEPDVDPGSAVYCEDHDGIATCYFGAVDPDADASSIFCEQVHATLVHCWLNGAEGVTP